MTIIHLFFKNMIEANDENSGNNFGDGWATIGLVEGDIVGLDEGSSADKFHNAINLEERLWNNGIVPYTISDTFSIELFFFNLFIVYQNECFSINYRAGRTGHYSTRYAKYYG